MALTLERVQEASGVRELLALDGIDFDDVGMYESAAAKAQAVMLWRVGQSLDLLRFDLSTHNDALCHRIAALTAKIDVGVDLMRPRRAERDAIPYYGGPVWVRAWWRLRVRARRAARHFREWLLGSDLP